ncbi:hypothetical protein F4679DRAFT_562251 [Xylaria curta]|nr:hypothetical protein F4679DRAFT_562251 [Xylaria curta]
MKALDFKVVQVASDQPSQYDLILLHPFRSSKNGPKVYRDALEGLLERAATMNEMKGKLNAYSCSFNGSEVITGETTIDTISKKLLTKLRKRRPLPESKESPSEEKSVPLVENDGARTITTKDQVQRGPPVLIFITHSIGSWVTRHMLTHTNEPTASIFDTVGMILLDDLDCHDLDDIKFQRYLDSIWPMISLQEKRQVMNSFPKDLMTNLGSIDRKFQNLQLGCVREGRPQDSTSGAVTESRFNIWTTEPTLGGDIKKEARATRILSWVNNLKRHIVKEARGKKDILSLLEREDINNAIKDLLSQPPSTSELKRPFPHNPQGNERRDESTYETSSDAGFMVLSAPHNIYHRRTLSFPARPSQRRSTYSLAAQSIVSDDEKASVGSYPAVILNNTTDENLKATIDLGKAFLKRGELKSAETAFIRCHLILEHLENHPKKRYDVEIRAQLAGIKLHRGNYKEAQREFNAVLNMMSDGFSTHEKNIVMRWIATSLLCQGRYEQAVEHFESLLKAVHVQNPSNIELTTQIPIRRDLALASAYQGDHKKAFRQISAARKCLGQLTGLNMLSSQSVPQSADNDKSMPKNSSETTLPTGFTNIVGKTLPKTPGTKALNEYRAKSDHLCLTESKIHYMCGDFQTALERAEIAMRGMKKRWGATHLMTLECAGQRAILLAFNSHVSEAEVACDKALLATRDELGPQHPQTLKTMGHLVRIYQFQARLVEAGDTARSLAKTTESSLTASHPQTHHSRYLVAETLLAAGDYTSAKVELERIIENSRAVYRDCHPDTLCYQSGLALAKYYRGETQEAEELAIYVLQEQWKIYFAPDSQTESPEKSHNGLRSSRSIKTIAQYQATLEDLLGRIKKDSANSNIPPFLFQTLRTIALIAQRNEDLENLDFQVFWAIWERNRSCLTQASIFTLDSEFDLALAYREEAEGSGIESSLKAAARHLKIVYQRRFLVLGPKHAGTISARRELITANCALGCWEPSLERENIDHVTEELAGYNESVCPLDDTKWGLIEAECQDIVYQHEGLVGKNHPETMKSLLWLFGVQILLRNEKGADETLRKSLQRLRQKSMRHERFVESLNLEQRFALALSDLGGKYEVKALQILREISYVIEELPEKDRGVLQKSIELLKGSNDSEVTRLSLKVNYHKSKWEAEMRSKIKLAVHKGSYREATTYQAELWSLLLASIGNRDDAQVLDARIQLAEFHLRSPDYGENKEGLQILEELTSKSSKTLTSNQTRRIEEARKIVDDKVAF